MVKCWPLNWNQNLICILFGAGELPWGLLVKFVPEKFFYQLSLEAKDLEAEKERTHISVAIKGKNKKKDKKKDNDSD